jgi:hypothetical protein
MYTIPETTIALQFTLDRIRALHGPVQHSGHTHCVHCKTVWPCETTSVALANHHDGTWNLDSSYFHLQGKTERLPQALRKLEEELSRLNTPLAEDAITAIHRLCMTDGISVAALINPIGLTEIQFYAEHEDGNAPLWALSTGSPIEMRLFGPERKGVGRDFFGSLIGLVFDTEDTDDAIDWWQGVTALRHTYVTTTLGGTDEDACRRILTLCSLTDSLAAPQGGQ